MRRFFLWLVLAFLASGAFWATYSFLEGPRYALYQIGKAIHDRDPRLFLAYVDLDTILRSQKDGLVDAFMPKGQSDDNTRSAVKGLIGAFMEPLSAQARSKVAQMVADPKRDNIPHSWTLMLAANITSNRTYALVVLSNPADGQHLRLGMKRQEGMWRVVEVDPRDLKRLIMEAMGDRLDSRLGGQPARGPVPAN